MGDLQLRVARRHYEGKTYCFSNEEDKAAFLKNPSDNVAKAEAFYKTHPQG